MGCSSAGIWMEPGMDGSDTMLLGISCLMDKASAAYNPQAGLANQIKPWAGSFTQILKALEYSTILQFKSTFFIIFLPVIFQSSTGEGSKRFSEKQSVWQWSASMRKKNGRA